jgi:hypothetical protein
VRVIGGALALALGLGLGACASVEEPELAPVIEEAIEAPPEAEVPPPVFDPEGGARENQAYVDFVITSALDASPGNRVGRVAIEALVQSGFDPSVLELTRDTSLIELPVDSISVAVRFDDQCVIAQWGSDWYVSQIEPVLVTGACLVGETVSLD